MARPDALPPDADAPDTDAPDADAPDADAPDEDAPDAPDEDAPDASDEDAPDADAPDASDRTVTSPDAGPPGDAFGEGGGTGGSTGGTGAFRFGAIGVGSRVGPYRLTGELGRGGMGTVFRGERADGQFAQEVAIKLLHPDTSANADFIRRFRTERQILASLDHPHIARLLDGGLIQDPAQGELPYLAMEFVEDAEPLTAFCDRRSLSIDARLRLFQQVCQAVQHAHGKLIIHRDLKPSNILVTEDESGTPQVKLLDFGIAKLLDTEALASQLSIIETREGQAPMTPAYAAPEQLLGQPVTVTTDVYQLGTILYELLVGQRPFDSFVGSPHQATLAIVEEEAPPPSQIARQMNERLVEVRSASTVENLARMLSGDLNTLVLKALRKEPERRYASVEALGEDVRRYRKGLPLTARPDTTGYRVRKFVTRNWPAVTAGALAALALVAGLTIAIWQARVANAERARAQAAAAQAQREATQAQAATDFLVGLFETGGSLQAMGDTLTAQDLVNRGRRRILEELDGEPEVQGRLLTTVGTIYASLGRFDQADSVLTLALALQRGALTAPHADLADTRTALGAVRAELGRYAEADSLHRQALATRRALLPNGHPLVAESLRGLALARGLQARFVEADTLLQNAIAILRTAGRTRTPDLVGALADRGRFLLQRGRYEPARAAYREALAIASAELPANHLARVDVLNGLALALVEQEQKYAEAERLFQDALAIEQQVRGTVHPALARTHLNLARLYRAQEDYAAAEAHVRDALRIFRASVGNAHPRTAATLVQLGAVLEARRARDEAASVLREAVAVHEAVYPPGHPRRMEAYAALGLFLQADRRTAPEAEPFLRQAVTLHERHLGPRADATLATREALALSLRAQGRLPEAEALLARNAAAEATRRDSLAAPLARRLRLVAEVQAEAGRLGAADSTFERALAVYDSLGDGAAHVAALLDYGSFLSRRRVYTRAESRLLRAHELLKARGASEARLDAARTRLARLYERWGRAARAAAWRNDFRQPLEPLAPSADS